MNFYVVKNVEKSHIWRVHCGCYEVFKFILNKIALIDYEIAIPNAPWSQILLKNLINSARRHISVNKMATYVDHDKKYINILKV
jgi:hypothetical protein